MKKLVYQIFLSLLIFCIQGCSEGNDLIRVLILSGSNNHEWQQTTPFLEQLLIGSGIFEVQITNRPDSLGKSDFQQFDVILDNWNSWPDNALRWPESTESAFLEFIRNGGGLVTFHASTSVFYNWPEFREISTSAWIADSTWHGENSVVKVIIDNHLHHVTKGMSGFYIFDELWVNAGVNQEFQNLGSASNTPLSNKGIKNQPAVMVSEYGKGKIFHTILGHDVRALRNTGFQTLILRGAEWAARGYVTQTHPQELRRNDVEEQSLAWQKSDSSFALLKGENLIWQFNFMTKHGRPFFHPVYVGNNNMTCLSPDDHRWHLGQWFCWKYINGINYWEYLDDTFTSEGTTEIREIEITPHSDFSAIIEMEIVYHPLKGEDVLSEKRIIEVSAPQENGGIWMDYKFSFEAVADTVLLDRTPIEGEPNGMSWGGYAGLSIRFNQDFMKSRFISSWGNNDSINGKTGNWLYMGFQGLDGKQVGSQIMIKPNSLREETAWYSVDSDEMPFFYFSPAVIYQKPLVLSKGEKLDLEYRVYHHNGDINETILNNRYTEFIKQGE